MFYQLLLCCVYSVVVAVALQGEGVGPVGLLASMPMDLPNYAHVCLQLMPETSLSFPMIPLNGSGPSVLTR